MQVVITCVLLFVVSGLGKPYYGQYLRIPRSHGYGGYISPCAGAGAYHALPAYHAPSYGLGHGGYPHAQIGAGYGGYGVPHYRADDGEDNVGEEPEMMSFSEMDQSENAPEARFVSLGSGYSAPHAISALAPASPGAVGVFPGAHVSGCNVPLLLSCSPSIVPGRIVSHGSSYGPAYGAAAPVAVAGYRSEAESPHEETHGEHTDAAAPQHATTVHEAANIGPNRTQ